jgi:hypothetical protein
MVEQGHRLRTAAASGKAGADCPMDANEGVYPIHMIQNMLLGASLTLPTHWSNMSIVKCSSNR